MTNAFNSVPYEKTQPIFIKKIFEYCNFSKKKNVKIFISIFAFACLLGVVLLAHLNLGKDLVKFGPAFLIKSGAFYFLALIFFLFLFIFLFLDLLTRKNFFVETSKNEIRFQKGKTIETWQWNEVKNIKIDSRSNNFRNRKKKSTLQLVNYKNKKFTLDSRLKNFEELIEIIRTNSFHHIYTFAHNLFVNQELGDFSAIKLHWVAGLIYKDQGIPLDKISIVKVKQGKIFLYSYENLKPIKIITKYVSNLDVLLALLKTQGVNTQHHM